MSYVGTLSYATAALLFSFFFALSISSWRGRLPGALLAFAALSSLTWASVSAYDAYQGAHTTTLTGVLEITRDASWCVFLITLLYSRPDPNPLLKTQRQSMLGLLAFSLVLVIMIVFPQSTTESSHLGPRSASLIAGYLILSLIGLVLVEQLYRNAEPRQRWGLKFLCFGVGGLFAYDFYLYADAMLFRRVDNDIWVARGFVNALVVPLIAVSAARNPNWSLEISVSRKILFHSATLLAAGLYLLGMSAVGYYIRFFGGQWGGVVQAAFLFGAIVLLLVILSSGALRARLRVLLSKHFFSYRYDYREEWLKFTQTLSQGEAGVRLRERSIQAIARLVESPGGALWLARESGVAERVAVWNMAIAATGESLDGAMCRFLEKRQWVLCLDEWRASSSRYEEIAVPDWLLSAPDAWLVVPLNHDERLTGFVVLARSLGGIRVNWEVGDLLRTAGRQAASYLAQVEAAEALMVARQFESFNRMSAFVVHDLKNLIAQLSLAVSNATKHSQNPAFQQDLISTIEYSVKKMKRLLSQLHRGQGEASPPSLFRLEDPIRRAVEARSGLQPTPALSVLDAGLTAHGDSERFERVIGHVIQNAIEATPVDGKVLVTLRREDRHALIEIRDNGCGMSEEFIREGLFRPFQSTKPTGMGIGAYETREYIQQLGGHVEIESEPRRGTLFRVRLLLVDGGEQPSSYSDTGVWDEPQQRHAVGR